MKEEDSQKYWFPTLMLCLFLGIFGAHRFYTKHKRTGYYQLATLGGLGVWWIIDLLSICLGQWHDASNRPLWKY